MILIHESNVGCLLQALVPMSPPQMSLSNLTVYSFGYFLSKKLRMTDWERRPLTQAEVTIKQIDTYFLTSDTCIHTYILC